MAEAAAKAAEAEKAKKEAAKASKGKKGSSDEATLTLDSESNLKMPPAQALALLKEELLKTHAGLKVDDAAVTEVLGYVAGLCSSLVDQMDFEPKAWEDYTSKNIPASVAPADAVKAAAASMRTICFKEAAGPGAVEEEEEGEDLCNCEFSLAYGGKILLNTARLHLKRGKRYALIGPNGA